MIQQGFGFEFLVLIALLFDIVGTLVISFVINWQLTLIMFCLMPIAIGSSFAFSKVQITYSINSVYKIFLQVTANETIDELNAYSKARHIVQEVFSSVRTVFSLNGSKFEQKR
jgi:ABC-type multidrug transport system fused ATPase/permease subunit